MSFVILEVYDGYLETSTEERLDNPRCIALVDNVISINTLGDSKNYDDTQRIWSSVVMRNVYASPLQVIETDQKSFIGADFITVIQ